jgi:hypothetical protein
VSDQIRPQHDRSVLKAPLLDRHEAEPASRFPLLPLIGPVRVGRPPSWREVRKKFFLSASKPKPRKFGQLRCPYQI